MNQTDDILNKRWYQDWRKSAGWLFLVIVFFDFLVFPLGNMSFTAYYHFNYVVWTPLTLQGSGLFYIAFLGILGISNYTKGLAEVEMIKNQPDYSSVPYGNFNGLGSQPFVQPMNPPLQPITPVPDAPNTYHRGIPTGH